MVAVLIYFLLGLVAFNPICFLMKIVFTRKFFYPNSLVEWPKSAHSETMAYVVVALHFAFIIGIILLSADMRAFQNATKPLESFRGKLIATKLIPPEKLSSQSIKMALFRNTYKLDSGKEVEEIVQIPGGPGILKYGENQTKRQSLDLTIYQLGSEYSDSWVILYLRIGDAILNSSREFKTLAIIGLLILIDVVLMWALMFRVKYVNQEN